MENRSLFCATPRPQIKICSKKVSFNQQLQSITKNRDSTSGTQNKIKTKHGEKCTLEHVTNQQTYILSQPADTSFLISNFKNSTNNQVSNQLKRHFVHNAQQKSNNSPDSTTSVSKKQRTNI